MNISEFASRVDETPRTIRFYESIGLLPDPEREPNDYRNYDDCDCDRVPIIRTLQSAGHALNDIARLLTIRDAPSPISDDDLRFITEKQSEVDAQLRTVNDFRTQLADLSHKRPNTKERHVATDRCRYQRDDEILHAEK